MDEESQDYGSALVEEIDTKDNTPDETSVEIKYAPVVESNGTLILGLPCLETAQYRGALFSIFMQFGSVVTFVSSSFVFRRSSSNAVIAYFNYMLASNGLSVAIYYVVICWIIIPIWQNYRFISKSRVVDIDNSLQEVPLMANQAHGVESEVIERASKCSYEGGEIIIQKRELPRGFLCCMCCCACCEFCCCQVLVLPKHESPHITRYIPCSLYNDVFCVLNPGYQLNPKLPDEMPRFGVARAMFFVLATNAKGNFHLYAFLFAFCQLYGRWNNLNAESDGLSVGLSFLSVLFAGIRLRVFLQSMAIGVLLMPMNLGWYLALVWFDLCGVISPKKNSYFYKVLRFFWRRMSE